jgi:hypothetical protein
LSNTTETLLFILQNHTVLNSKFISIPVTLNEFSAAAIKSGGGGGSGVSLITIRIYKKPTFSVTPTYTQVNTKTAMRYATAATITSNGLLVKQFELTEGATVNQFLHQKYDTIIEPGYEFLLTAQTTLASVDVRRTLNWVEFS